MWYYHASFAEGRRNTGPLVIPSPVINVETPPATYNSNSLFIYAQTRAPQTSISGIILFLFFIKLFNKLYAKNLRHQEHILWSHELF